MTSQRTMLVISCTSDEAEAIREAAKRERRTISAFIVNAVMTRPAYQGRLQEATRPGKRP